MKRCAWNAFFVFAILAIGSTAWAVQPSVFPQTPTFTIYAPPGGVAYLASLGVAADVNGDGTPDLIYTEVPGSGSSDAYLVAVLGQAGSQPSQIPTDLGACTPNGLAAADVNGDKKADVVLTCSQGYMEVLIGNGDGAFQTPVVSTAPTGDRYAVLADFNGDGHPDIALSGGTVYAIYLNTGNGHFGTPQTYSLPAQSNSSQMAAGDINGDGKQDLVFPTGYLLGNGDGTFGSPISLPSGIQSFTLGDWNNDGYEDLAAVIATPSQSGTSTSYGLYLLIGSSSGLSTQPTLIANGYQNALLQARVLPGSSNLDLIASLAGGGFAVFNGNGKGAFSGPLSYGNLSFFGNLPAAFADMNGDGIPDLVGGFDSTFTAAYGDADGTFQGIPMTATGSNLATTTADINGDGLIDVIVRDTISSNAPQVYLANGNGRFTPVAVGSTGSTGDHGDLLLSADLNGDGRPDLVSISPGVDHEACGGGCPQPAQLTSYLSNGNGSLTYVAQQTTSFQVVTGAVSGDFNGDSKQDLVLTYDDQLANAGGAVFLAGKGDGTFADSVPIGLLGNAPTSIAVADLNNDHKLDLVVADQSGTVASLLGNDDGTFTPTSSPLQVNTTSIDLADVNGDQIPDLICTSGAGGGELEVFPGVGDGTFSATPSFTAALAGSPVIQAVGT
jgi:FG-GAP-like repeat